MAREMRYHAMEVNSKLFLGKILRDRGEFDRARAVLAEAADAFRENGSKDDLVEVLAALACLAAMRGEAERAFRLAAAVESAGSASGVTILPVVRHEIDARLAAVRGRLRDDALARAEARGRAMSLDEALCEALASG